MKNLDIKQLILSTLTLLLAVSSLMASSHREAPLISNDPLADNVDVYAFRSPDDPNTVTLIATYIPFQLPHGGPNYYTFGENIRYEIHVDNDASTTGDDVTYRFTFNITNEDPTTFFNMNIGDRSIEGAAGLNTTYDELWESAMMTASTGETVFAGPTDDPFFVDLGGIFDLGDAPRQSGTPVDGVGCYNVSTIAIKVPIATLLKDGAPSTPENILDPNYVIGVWASASRPSITTLSSGSNPTYAGDWVQVSRLGMPLTNEAVIPIGYKDFWNSITPYQELTETEMDEFFYNPELALYMDDDQFGAAVPGFSPLRIQTASLGSFDFTNGADGVSALAGGDLTGTAFETFGDLLLIPGKPRSVDLWPIFHTGVPNAIPYQLATGKDGNPLAAGKPFINNFLPNGGDMLRLNMAVPPTPRDDPNFSSLGLVQAAAIGLTVAPFNTSADLEFIPNMDGFPNGRRLEDDVTRIELQAVGGVVLAAVGLWYDDYDPATSPSPVTEDLLNVLTYTTGVEANDKPFLSSFPYVAMPFSGTGGCSGEPVGPEIELETVGRFYSSSNTESTVFVYDVKEDQSLAVGGFASETMDADGIHLDFATDVLFEVDRDNNLVNMYGDVTAALDAGQIPQLISTSSSNFTNGRGIAVIGDRVVVAQDAADTNNNENKLLVYKVDGQSIVLDAEYPVTFNLWGIHAESDRLFAIIDNSSSIAVLDNFFEKPIGTTAPDREVVVEGLVRTHGISYDADMDVMTLTDVGDAASGEDGAVIVIQNYNTASEDGTITMAEQRRIAGPSTLLGNPVDVTVDHMTGIVYVAERRNAGGRMLAFAADAMGDATPIHNVIQPGASSIFFDNEKSGTVATENIDSDVNQYLTVYPNPTSQFLHVEVDTDMELSNGGYAMIIDVTGRVLSSAPITQVKSIIDVSMIPTGMYILNVVNGEAVMSTKFTKVK